MRDPDFQEVWDAITKALGRFAKLAYAVDPNASPDSIGFWSHRGIQIFKTSDVSFLIQLREKLEDENLIPTQKFIDSLRIQRRKIVSIHLNLSQNSSGGMASSMYQDGLLHALDEVISSSILGSKRNQDFEFELAYAEKAVREKQRARDPVEIAYWSGRREVYGHFCSRDPSTFPAYFHPSKLLPITKFVQG